MNEQQTLENSASTNLSRRRFVGYAGALAGIGLLAGGIACKKEDDPLAGALNPGGGDMGVFNVVYVLAQLQTAFFYQVLQTPYTPIKSSDTKGEYPVIQDMHDHHLAHREFYRKVLGGAAIQDITPNFSSVFFIKRTSVLDTAKMFADLTVSAYNGSAKLLTTDAYLDVFNKMASVQARHAAMISDMIQMGSFADMSVIGSDGLEASREPSDVIAIIAPFIKERINPNSLPTS